ncbi:MAG: THUMP domain-containing protein [Candidatus Njordarchaeales archaeon]
MPILLLKTIPEISDLAIKEINFFSISSAKIVEQWPDLISINSTDINSDFVKLVLLGKTFYSVLYKIFDDEINVEDRKSIYNRVKDLPWQSFWDVDQTFAVRCEGINKNKSKTLAKDIGQAIVDQFRNSTGKKIKVNLKNPDIEILARLKNNRLLLAINLTKSDINESIDILVRSGIILSGWDTKSKFGEILCGGFSVSAYELAKNEANRERFLRTAFIKTKFADREKIIKLLRRSWSKELLTTIDCYERESRINICKEKIKGYREIALKKLDAIFNSEKEVLATNLYVTSRKKGEQEADLRWIINNVLNNHFWKTFIFIARGDIKDLKNIPNQVEHRKIQIKGTEISLIMSLRE